MGQDVAKYSSCYQVTWIILDCSCFSPSPYFCCENCGIFGIYQVTIMFRKTILMAYPQMKEECKNLKSSYNCYKLLGFDIMLEENLKPWVLEVL